MDKSSVERAYCRLKAKLAHVVPDEELRIKAELVAEIEQLKLERNAFILGHNYMEPALFHSVPDATGDSLGLSRTAAAVEADVIVFCGVVFMAETAKILNPEKTVLIPSLDAGCSLAESITAADVRKLRRQYPGVPVVTYVNTSAEVKAESDICCTSGNAKAVIESLGDGPVIFLPDEFLARNTARETGRRIIFPHVGPRAAAGQDDNLEYAMVGWSGRCEVHEQFTVEDIANVRAQFPDVLVLSHPECSPEVVEASDFSGSTTAMIDHVRQSNAEQYLLLTECAMGDNVAAENPDKEMLRLCSVRCPHMNQITLEQTRDALLYLQHKIELPAQVIRGASRAVKRMLEIRNPSPALV
jgi:quinolinate synthase